MRASIMLNRAREWLAAATSAASSTAPLAMSTLQQVPQRHEWVLGSGCLQHRERHRCVWPQKNLH